MGLRKLRHHNSPRLNVTVLLDCRRTSRPHTALFPPRNNCPPRSTAVQIHTIIWRAHNMEEILEKLKTIGGEVMTCFPPDSNGYLHFGDVKYSDLSSKQDRFFHLTELTPPQLPLMLRKFTSVCQEFARRVVLLLQAIDQGWRRRRH